jgi:putative nucleotidyltransferase with HDIG domain
MALVLMAHRPWPLDGFMYAGTVLMCVVAVILTSFHLRHTPLKTTSRKAEGIVALTAMLGVFGVQLATRSLGEQSLLGPGFLLTAPLVAQAMLVAALIGPAVSLYALTVVTLLLGVSRALPVEVLASAWLAGAVGSHAVNPLKHRSDLLRATGIQIGAQAIIALCVTAVSTNDAGLVLESAGWAALAAVGGTSLFWLMVAVLERLFGIVSDWSLLELCSPDQPLMRELCLRAPGTYAHSVMVGNLGESAARAIGANPVLVRAMAYYHDVGKTVRPGYFIENQVGRNVHDEMSPTMSAMVISAHVKDGIELARSHHLPEAIVDGIAQHHGTGLIAYFYNRALEQDGGLETMVGLERFFRYEGPRPQTREAAILLLADSVEAASRALPRDQIEDLEVMVLRIIEERRADGQLDDSDLTLKDLQRIREAFLNALCAIRHERVAYPEEVGGDQNDPPPGLDRQRMPEAGAVERDSDRD